MQGKVDPQGLLCLAWDHLLEHVFVFDHLHEVQTCPKLIQFCQISRARIRTEYEWNERTPTQKCWHFYRVKALGQCVISVFYWFLLYTNFLISKIFSFSYKQNKENNIDSGRAADFFLRFTLFLTWFYIISDDICWDFEFISFFISKM